MCTSCAFCSSPSFSWYHFAFIVWKKLLCFSCFLSPFTFGWFQSVNAINNKYWKVKVSTVMNEVNCPCWEQGMISDTIFILNCVKLETLCCSQYYKLISRLLGKATELYASSQTNGTNQWHSWGKKWHVVNIFIFIIESCMILTPVPNYRLKTNQSVHSSVFMCLLQWCDLMCEMLHYTCSQFHHTVFHLKNKYKMFNWSMCKLPPDFCEQQTNHPQLFY